MRNQLYYCARIAFEIVLLFEGFVFALRGETFEALTMCALAIILSRLNPSPGEKEGT